LSFFTLELNLLCGCIIYIQIIQMLQNKIYQNFSIEILKNFLVILLGLSLIALTVRAVSFLDLIVESGYPVSTYFAYSILNLFGIMPKFIPLAFLLSLTIFISKHLQDNEFIILWTSGVKKIQIVNLLFKISLVIVIIYLSFTVFITPFFLNKSRFLLNNDQVNSFLPTIKKQQFSDTFKNFTFFVDNKESNIIENIFLNDNGNKLKSFSSNRSENLNTTIVAQKGIVKDKIIFLFNGQIISSKIDNSENEIIKFEQINIDLSDLSSSTIKQPKLQETSTIKLLNCFKYSSFANKICDGKIKEEIISVLNRRLFLPFYIPLLSLLCCFQLIRSEKFILKKFSVFIYSFLLVLFTELSVRLTGVNFFVRNLFFLTPIILFSIFYFFLFKKFSNEAKLK